MALTKAEVGRRYRERHPGRAREASRRWRAKNPGAGREHTRRWEKKTGYKYTNAKGWRSHDAVKRAKKAGRLVPEPCLFCDSTVGVVAHHHDYDQPLAVTWLCRRHHALAHS